MSSVTKVATLSVFPLVMLITGAIDSIRNLPSTALFGSSLIFFSIVSAIIFLIPSALVSAELSSNSTEKGGIFHWIKLAFGEKIGFLAVWLQWANTMIWFPTILSFIAATATYLINPELAQNKIYLLCMILGVFWSLTILGLCGVRVSTWVASIFTLTGMIIPMIIIIILALLWLILGKPLQIHFSTATLFPSLNHTQNWISLTAIMNSFLGIELATVHVKDFKNPQTTFPRAMFISTIIILATMIFGSLAIAFVVPPDQINLVNGVTEAFTHFFVAYNLQWIMPIIVLMIVIGGLGNMINWVIAPAKGLLQASEHNFLPTYFQKTNQHGVSNNLLIAQAILISIICLAFLLMPSVNGAYWLLTALSVQLYMIMYVLLFIAAIYLRYKYPQQTKAFQIPGGKWGIWLTCLLGLIGSLITLLIGFFPPDGINVGSILHYEIIFTSGILAMLLPLIIFYLYKNKTTKIDEFQQTIPAGTEIQVF